MVMPFSSHLDETFQHTKPTTLSVNKICWTRVEATLRAFCSILWKHIANLKGCSTTI